MSQNISIDYKGKRVVLVEKNGAVVEYEFKWSRTVDQIVDEKVNKKGKTLLFMASTWQRLYDPFVPMDTGLLAHDSVDVYVEDGAGVIHHKAPYAAITYYGTGRNFSREKHQLATARWDEAAKAAGKDKDLIKSVDEYIKSG